MRALVTIMVPRAFVRVPAGRPGGRQTPRPCSNTCSGALLGGSSYTRAEGTRKRRHAAEPGRRVAGLPLILDAAFGPPDQDVQPRREPEAVAAAPLDDRRHPRLL